MSCRGCEGRPICEALNICCIQIKQDCGDGCVDLPNGYTRLQIDAAGQLNICSNVNDVCSCVPLLTSDSFSVVKYLNTSPDIIAPDNTIIAFPADNIERDPRNEWSLIGVPSTPIWTAKNAGTYLIYGSVHFNTTHPVFSIFQDFRISYLVNSLSLPREVVAIHQKSGDIATWIPEKLWLLRGHTIERLNQGDTLEFRVFQSGTGSAQKIISIGNETYLKIIQIG